MTGDEMRAIRKRLRLSVDAFAVALGYTGNRNTLSVTVRRYENGTRPIPPWIERLIGMYGRYGIPPPYLDAPARGAVVDDMEESG